MVRQGYRSFIAQCCSYAHVRDMALAKYGGGSKRSFIGTFEAFGGSALTTILLVQGSLVDRASS